MHGPHHSAKKSTNTGLDPLMISPKVRLSNLSKTQVTSTSEKVPSEVKEQTNAADLAKQRKDAQADVNSAAVEVQQAKVYLSAAQKELSAVSI